MRILPSSRYGYVKTVYEPADFPGLEYLDGILEDSQMRAYDGTNSDRTLAILFKVALEAGADDILLGDPQLVQSFDEEGSIEQYSSVLARRFLSAFVKSGQGYELPQSIDLAHDMVKFVEKFTYVYSMLEEITSKQAEVELLHLFYALWIMDAASHKHPFEYTVAKWTKVFYETSPAPSEEWVVEASSMIALLEVTHENRYVFQFMTAVREMGLETRQRIVAGLESNNAVIMQRRMLMDLNESLGSWEGVADAIENIPMSTLLLLGEPENVIF